MNKRSKACDISRAVKNEAWERDGHCCIICGSPAAMPNSHYIKRSQGGLGIPKNIATMCLNCHTEYDSGHNPERIKAKFKLYLKSCYPDWDEKELVYNKWEGFKFDY
jgi:hypothetical protein